MRTMLVALVVVSVVACVPKAHLSNKAFKPVRGAVAHYRGEGDGRALAVEEIEDFCGSAGYDVTSEAPGRVEFTCRSRDTWSR